MVDFSQLFPGIQCRNYITKLWTGILNRMYLKEVKCTPKTKHHLKSMLTISTCVESKIHTSSSCSWWYSERVWFLPLECFSVVGIGLFCRRDTAGTSAQQKICLCKQKDQKLFMWIWFNFMWLVMWPCLYPNPAPVAALTSRSRTLLTALDAVRGSVRACCSSGRRNFSSSFLAAVSSSSMGFWKHVTSLNTVYRT